MLLSVYVATTRGHMEEREQEMPDVHQPDLSVAEGEQGFRLGVPPPPSHDPSAMSEASFDFFPKKNKDHFSFSPLVTEASSCDSEGALMLDILKDKQMGKACKSRSATHTHTQAELLNNLSGVSRKLLGQTITVHINTHHVFLSGKRDLPQHSLWQLDVIIARCRFRRNGCLTQN